MLVVVHSEVIRRFWGACRCFDLHFIYFALCVEGLLGINPRVISLAASIF
jgi:hypothetical protein